MEYLIGSLLGMASVFVSMKFIKTKTEKPRPKIKVTQSKIYSIISPAMPILAILEKLKRKDTQTARFERSNTVRVLVVDNQAYWIKDNAVYEAEMVDDYIDNESAKVVDIINMDTIQLEKMKFIIEKLTEGNENDSGYSGH